MTEETSIKERMALLIKTYGLDTKTVVAAVNKLSSNLKLEKSEKKKAIIESVELAGKEGLEPETGCLLVSIGIIFNTKTEDVKERFNKLISKSDYREIESKTHREKLAARAVRARLSWESQIKLKDFEVVVLGKSSPRPMTTKKGSTMIANLAGYFTSLEEDDIAPFYRNLAFWGVDGNKVNEIIIGHRYQCGLTRNRSGDDLMAWNPLEKETRFVHKGKFDGNISDILENIKPRKITISEVDFFESKGHHDYRRIDCEILRILIRDNGSMIFVMDESTENEIFRGDGEGDSEVGLRIYIDPQNLVYGEGSEVAVVGRIRKDGNGKLNMNADCLLPILTIPRDLTPVDDEDEMGMKSGERPVIDPDTLTGEGSENEDLLTLDEDDEDDGDMFG